MSSNDSIKGIPIKIAPSAASMRLHWQRRAMQIATILIAILIPVTGLFRIDPIAGAFVVIDRQIWWADFFIVFGFWLVLASGLVLLYSTVGTAFCGWSCPQNSLSEWANHLTRKLLGKRAEVSLDGEAMKVGRSKNKWINWTVLGVSFFVVAMFFALIPMFYFYSPAVIWSFVTFQQDERLADSLHYIYFIFVLVIFLDIAFIRHFWCRFMCIYKVWQHGFKTQQTLHVAYDSMRADLCEKCNFCVTQCFLDLDPRKTDIYDTCINCGECITACNNLQARKGQRGLLSFKIGDQNASRLSLLKTRLSSLSSRVHWTIPVAVIGLAMFVWGLMSYESYHLSVYRADTLQGVQINDYRIALSNKRYQAASVSLEVVGLEPQQYQLEKAQASFDSIGRIDLKMHINQGLSPGLHAFIVKANSNDGWSDSFRVQHFVATRLGN